jgi:hypothetical protein
MEEVLELEGTSDDLKGKIVSMPVVRGALGSSEDAWRICGSGRKIAKVKEWEEAGDFPEDWENLLGLSFTKFAQAESLSQYRCPGDSCDMGI